MPPPEHAYDDAALIERSWRDPEAFAGLYDRHAAPLHRYAARRLGGGATDDIVADTFLDAFRKRRRYDRTVTDARPLMDARSTPVGARSATTAGSVTRRSFGAEGNTDLRSGASSMAGGDADGS